MYQEEIVVKIVGKLLMMYPDVIDQREVRSMVEEVLYDFDVKPTEKSLVVLNNIKQKGMIFIQMKQLDGLSSKTLDNYSRHIRRFAEYMQKNIEDITYMDLRMYLAAYMQRVKPKDSTVNTEISILKSFFGWLYDQGHIPNNPAKNLKHVKAEKRLRKPLTVEELEMLRIACETPRERALLEFLYATGCRLDEVYKLNRHDVDWQHLRVNVIGKGDKERTVKLNDKAKVYIQKYLMGRLDNCEALFVTERKPCKRLGHRSMQREIKKLGERAGVKKSVHPHLMRHTMATNLINNGAALVTVQHLLGHSDPATTLIYTEISSQSIELEYKKCMLQ